MSQVSLRTALKILVVMFLLTVIGPSINAATLRWENDIEDWDKGVILGVDDLYVPQNDTTYDVTFVDGDDPLIIYGLDPLVRYGELYPSARWTTGHQIGALRSYFDGLSAMNIDPRLINGIEDKSQFNIGVINVLYWYNAAGLGQMQASGLGIFLNSSDMSVGGGWHSPNKYVTYDEIYGDRVYATFVESSTVPVPSTLVLLGCGLLSFVGIARKKE